MRINPDKNYLWSLVTNDKSMFILADKRIPEKVKYKLGKFGEILFVETQGITYPAISGHPDIFFCKVPGKLLIAANTPESIQQQLRQKSILFLEGKSAVGEKYPGSAHYNAVVTNRLFIHNFQLSDAALTDECATLESLHVNQGYTRCNLIPLHNNRFITSDRGIEKSLLDRGFGVLFVHPQGILLPGFAHGFIGGCCGTFEDKIFIIGSLKHFPEGDKIRNFVNGMEIVELYDGPLFDGGSLIFID